MANELADEMSDLDDDTVNARIADWHQKLTRTRNMYLERNMYIDGLTKVKTMHFRWRTNPTVIAHYMNDADVPRQAEVTLKPNEAGSWKTARLSGPYHKRTWKQIPNWSLQQIVWENQSVRSCSLSPDRTLFSFKYEELQRTVMRSIAS